MILRHTSALRHDDGRHFDYGVRPLWVHPSRNLLDLGMGSMAEIAFKPGLSHMENSFGLRRADTRFRHWSGCRVNGRGCGGMPESGTKYSLAMKGSGLGFLASILALVLSLIGKGPARLPASLASFGLAALWLVAALTY